MIKLIRGSLVQLSQAVRGKRHGNHYVRFWGIAFSGFGIGIAFPREHKTTPEQREESDRQLIYRKMEEYELRNRRN